MQTVQGPTHRDFQFRATHLGRSTLVGRGEVLDDYRPGQHELVHNGAHIGQLQRFQLNRRPSIESDPSPATEEPPAEYHRAPASDPQRAQSDQSPATEPQLTPLERPRLTDKQFAEAAQRAQNQQNELQKMLMLLWSERQKAMVETWKMLEDTRTDICRMIRDAWLVRGQAGRKTMALWGNYLSDVPWKDW
ncbi:MAG: hypothetical protein HY319_13490 [Armatimonadetes bacterium]|nr:hypothetical protein [Armatimonadota bacterium]